MKTKVLLVLLVISSTSAARGGTSELFGITIGAKAPDNLLAAATSERSFDFLEVPTRGQSLSEFLYQANVFLLMDSGIVAGVRADRVYPSAAACEEAANRVNEIIRGSFSASYTGDDYRFTRQSADGKVVAGARCDQQKPFVTLTLEVGNPQLELELRERMVHGG